MIMRYDLAQLENRIGAAPAGIIATGVPGVRLFWSAITTPAAPLVYAPGIVVILQGRKEGSLDGRALVYDTGNYLTLTLPMPFLCAHVASKQAPLIGLFIDALREDLSDLLGQLDPLGAIRPRTGEMAVEPAPVTPAMRLSMARLIESLADPVAAAVLGPALRREILFHALRGPRGPALAAYAMQTGDDGKLDTLIDAICQDFRAKISVEALADRAGMSLSSFHRAFRSRTGQSPLQYVKRLRLHAARDMILFDGTRIGEAARRVGYENTSQFCREYRRHFGEAASATKEAAAEPGSGDGGHGRGRDPTAA